MTASEERWEDQTGDALSNQEIYDKLLEHQAAGILSYVLPTNPLGQQWVLGIAGEIVKLHGKAQAVAFLHGVNAVIILLARNLGEGAPLRTEA